MVIGVQVWIQRVLEAKQIESLCGEGLICERPEMIPLRHFGLDTTKEKRPWKQPKKFNISLKAFAAVDCKKQLLVNQCGSETMRLSPEEFFAPDKASGSAISILGFLDCYSAVVSGDHAVLSGVAVWLF